MSRHLESLAKRVESDPFFLACVLRQYAESENLNDAQVAAVLGCAEATLPQLRLCRAPASEAKVFQADVDRIAARFGIRAEVLAGAVRRGQVLLKVREANPVNAAVFMAARDRPNPSRGEL